MLAFPNPSLLTDLMKEDDNLLSEVNRLNQALPNTTPSQIASTGVKVDALDSKIYDLVVEFYGELNIF